MLMCAVLCAVWCWLVLPVCSAAPHVVSAYLARLLSVSLSLWTAAGVDDESAWPAKAKLAGIIREVAAHRQHRQAVRERIADITQLLHRDAECTDYTLRTVRPQRTQPCTAQQRHMAAASSSPVPMPMLHPHRR